MSKSCKDDSVQQFQNLWQTHRDVDIESSVEEVLETLGWDVDDGYEGTGEEVLMVADLVATESPEGEDKQTPKGRQPREKTLSRRALARLYREHGRVPEETVLWMEALRPTLRSQCREGVRPCPHVSCRHHLYLDVNPETGSIKLNFPNIEVWEMKESCALDVAERGGVTLEEVGQLMNLTRERIRQLESDALERVKANIEERALTQDLKDFEIIKN